MPVLNVFTFLSALFVFTDRDISSFVVRSSLG